MGTQANRRVGTAADRLKRCSVPIPGSDRKIDEMRRRAELGEDLFRGDDPGSGVPEDEGLVAPECEDEMDAQDE